MGSPTFDHAQAISDTLSGDTIRAVAERNGVSRERMRKLKSRARSRAHARARAAADPEAVVVPTPAPEAVPA